MSVKDQRGSAVPEELLLAEEVRGLGAALREELLELVVEVGRRRIVALSEGEERIRLGRVGQDDDLRGRLPSSGPPGPLARRLPEAQRPGRCHARKASTSQGKAPG